MTNVFSLETSGEPCGSQSQCDHNALLNTGERFGAVTRKCEHRRCLDLCSFLSVCPTSKLEAQEPEGTQAESKANFWISHHRQLDFDNRIFQISLSKTKTNGTPLD